MSLEVLKGGLFKRECTPKDDSQMILKIFTCHVPGPDPDLRFAQRHSPYCYTIIYRL